MGESFDALKLKVAQTAGCSVTVSDNDAFAEGGQASVWMQFANGTQLRADYWRISKVGHARLSSWDHDQKYGLAAVINAKDELRLLMHGKTVTDAQVDHETRDLVFAFTDNIKLQVFTLSSYEDWEIRFPDGTGEYSNYARYTT